MSADPPSANQKFKENQGFEYKLLSDESHIMLRDYFAWGKKKLYGREYEGVHRISYIIDENGKVMKTYPKVQTQTHAQDILEDLKIT